MANKVFMFNLAAALLVLCACQHLVPTTTAQCKGFDADCKEDSNCCSRSCNLLHSEDGERGSCRCSDVGQRCSQDYDCCGETAAGTALYCAPAARRGATRTCKACSIITNKDCSKGPACCDGLKCLKFELGGIKVNRCLIPGTLDR